MFSLLQFAQFLADRQPGDLPEAIAQRVRYHLLDTLGAWVAGRETTEAALLKAYAAKLHGDGLRRASPADLLVDIQLHCALARMSEIDDIHQAAGVTPGAVIVPAALAIAAYHNDIDDDALLDAIAAGYEAMCRLGLAIGGPACLYRGIWTTYITAPFGVAAVASRLLKLDSKQTAEALTLALTVASPNVSHHNLATTSRWVALGAMAREGLGAALAARAGFTSDLGIFESSFFSGIYNITPDPNQLTEGLGESFAIAGCSIKPWCAARQTMAATFAFKELLAEGVLPDTVERIEVAVPPPYFRMVNHGVTLGDRASFLTSLPYRLAIAAFDPAADFDIAQNPSGIFGPVTDLMAKVAVNEDPALLEGYPQSWSARVTIHAGGQTRQRFCQHVPGDAAFALDSMLVKAKFERFAPPQLKTFVPRLLSADGLDIQFSKMLYADVQRSIGISS